MEIIDIFQIITMANFIITPYAIAQFITAGISIIVATMMWSRRSVRGGTALFLLFAAISEWAFGNGLESAAVDWELKIILSKFVYIGAQSSPVFLVIFVLEYTGRIGKIKPAAIAALFIVPVGIMILAATNEAHHLIWSGFSAGPVGSNSMIYHHGIAFWVGMIYVYMIVSFSTALLTISAVSTQKIYQVQNIVLVLGSFVPWIGTLIYLVEPNPFPGLDTISISFMFTGLLLMLGITRSNLMDYIPIAYEMLFNSINDGVVVFDENMRIIDLNPAASKLVGTNFQQMSEGKNKDELKHWDEVRQYFQKDKPSRFEVVSPFNEDVWLSVNISPLQNKHGNFLGWVAISEDITHRKKTEEELRQINQRLGNQLDDISKLEYQLRDQVNRDALTGVFNRGYLEEILKQELMKAEMAGSSISVMMLDVDDFKLINDSFGHKAGDEVVIKLGKMLEKRTREKDCVSRYGGDEFVLILPGMESESAFIRAEILRSELSSIQFSFSSQYKPITISIGISSYPEQGRTNDELLSAADSALYHAKQSGKDCTCWAGK
jgi:diguanylate cyclase (GGDEF)-like protein/PAS domain S-box-containing protein